MKNNHYPLVSVIVATYRRSQALQSALQSLAIQSYKNFQIVLVDDNANAEWNQIVENIVSSFQADFENIELIYLKNTSNLGSAQSRNKGIEKSKGVYITFLDDDDIYLKDKVTSQVEFMEEGKYDYSITNLDLYFENGKLSDRRNRRYIKKYDQKSLLEYHLKYHMTGTDTFMFKKHYLEKIGMFAPIDIGDEFYLMERAIEGGGNFGYLDRCEIKAFVHTNEDGLSSGRKKIEGENELFNYKKSFFKEIDAKSRRFIRMRHYAVIAFAELRMQNRRLFILNAIKSFLCAPVSCLIFLKSLR